MTVRNSWALSFLPGNVSIVQEPRGWFPGRAIGGPARFAKRARVEKHL